CPVGCLVIPRPRASRVFPYTTLFRSKIDVGNDWTEISETARASCGHAPDLGKNSVFISELIATCLERGKDLDGLNSAALKISELDRKSTRLNSSHVKISYAVFCLKKK